MPPTPEAPKPSATAARIREMAAGYGELRLVEQPAIALLESLGWTHADLYAERLGVDGTEGRESESQVVLVRRLRGALERLNPGLPADAYDQAIEEIARDRSKQIAVNANREVSFPKIPQVLNTLRVAHDPN